MNLLSHKTGRELTEYTRQQHVEILKGLKIKATEIGAPVLFIRSLTKQIEACDNIPYNHANKFKPWTPDYDDRYPESLVGQVACFLYAMHILLGTAPTDIVVEGDRQLQTSQAIDIIVRYEDTPSNVQVKIGHVGTRNDPIYQNKWDKGDSSTLTIASIVWETHTLYEAKLAEWKRMAKEQYCKYIPAFEFKKCGRIERFDQSLIDIVNAAVLLKEI